MADTDLEEAKVVLKIVDKCDEEEAKELLSAAGYHPDDADDLIEASQRLLLIANETGTEERAS